VSRATTSMDIDDDVHSIRITGHGKIKHWVSFALKSFEVRC